MNVVFVPVLHTAVSYAVSFGRRWSVLEHMLLVELAGSRRTVAELAEAADLPPRMIVEALINLLRANWVEVCADAAGVFFRATAVGMRRSKDAELEAQVSRDTKFTSLCFDQVTGSWLRADDLSLVYHEDLPEGADVLNAVYRTFDTSDGSFRDLLYLDPDQSLERDAPYLRPPSRPYARMGVSVGQVFGIPPYAPLRLREVVMERAREGEAEVREVEQEQPLSAAAEMRDTFGPDDVVVGGDAHLNMVRQALRNAQTTVVIHSCFVHPEVVRRLLPEFEAASRRKVKVELLWGLVRDPESDGNPTSIKDAERVLESLAPNLRPRVQMSPQSSGSHAKLIVHDCADGSWRSMVSSCNFLSSWYDAIDISVISRSQLLAKRLLGWMVGAQLPAAGSWSPTARRLNRYWGLARESAVLRPDVGDHRITLLVDEDHYACIRRARDESSERIVLGCDLYGIAAETSVLVPMERAVERGRGVHLFFQRPSKLITDEERMPTDAELVARGLPMKRIEKLHGKFLVWDDLAAAISSFNWLATTADGTRARGAEIGVLIRFPGVARLLRSHFEALDGGEALAEALRLTNETGALNSST